MFGSKLKSYLYSEQLPCGSSWLAKFMESCISFAGYLCPSGQALFAKFPSSLFVYHW